jgi:NAD(P)-dependent dehydrogenase (short-subunit alcohol dehydrogenase family)
VTGRRVERCAELKAEIEAADGTAHAEALDVTDEASIAACLDATEKALGPVDILINNAGMNREGLAVDLPAEDFDAIFRTNVRGAFLMAREAGKRMIAGGRGGQVVNIASIGAFKVLPGVTPYCMSKAAVVMMTKGLAREWANKGVNVNAICPGYIVTEINEDWLQSEGGKKMLSRFPRRRAGEERDLDGALLLLADPKTRFMTGSVISVDDGQTL